MRNAVRAAALAGAAFGSAAWPMAAWAADADEAPGDEAIVVLGQRLEESTPEELEKYGSRLEVVDGEAIDKAGFVDVAQALQFLVPGLHVSPKSGAFDYVDVALLGSRSSEVLFTVDGVRMSNRLYSTTTPIDTLPASMIEKIEVLKGGQGLYYGTQAVGGIVNVVTRGFTRETDGAAELGWDSNEGYHANGYLRGAAGNHYFVAYASHDEAEGFMAFRPQDYQPSATARKRGYNMTGAGLKYAFEPSDAFRLTASYQHNEGRVDFAGAEDRAIGYNGRNEEIASLKLDWTPSERFGLYVKGYWHDWDSTYTEYWNELGADGRPNGNLITIDDHDPWQFEDRGLNVLAEYRLTEAVAVVGGYDYQKYNGQDAVFLIGEHAEEVHAPFAQVKLDTGALSLAAGVRHNMPSDGQEKTVWNVSGRLGLGERAYLRGQVGTSFRLPDAYELYVIDPCCETGNPNLVAEESFNVEGGVGLKGGAFSGEIAGFYRKTDNLIDITFDLPAYPDGFLINTPDAVKAWGGELTLNARLTDTLSATFDYTHSEVEVEGTGQQIPEIPRDEVKLLLTAQEPGGRFGGNVAVNYVGDVYSNAAAIGRVEHGNYALVDLSLFLFLDEAQHHRIGLRLENALDETYASRIVRIRQDVTNASYAGWNLGTPMTAHVTYRLSL